MNLPSQFFASLLEPFIHDGWVYVDAMNPKPLFSPLYLYIYLSTIISRLSTHLLQYASQISAHFFYKKSRVHTLLFEHVM
jgi:hypothetical protein